MVECEFIKFTNIAGIGNVLIDTWWNVNGETLNFVVRGFCVLIDTWWNVNDYFRDGVGYLQAVLIDTWWNVNAIAYP